MKLKRLSDFLAAQDVENGAVVTIIGEPTLRPAEETRFNKDVCIIKVKLMNGDQKDWTLNKITYHKLLDAFGDESKSWLNRQVVIRKTQQNVRGTMRDVLYGEPYKEPQQILSPSQQGKVTLQEAISKTKEWKAEDQKAYIDYLRNTGQLLE